MENKTNRHTVAVSDIVYATVLACGRTVYRATYAGMSSIEDIIKAVRNGVHNVIGPLTVSLRNGTQGWTMRSTMMRSVPSPEAVQLTLW